MVICRQAEMREMTGVRGRGLAAGAVTFMGLDKLRPALIAAKSYNKASGIIPRNLERNLERCSA